MTEYLRNAIVLAADPLDSLLKELDALEEVVLEPLRLAGDEGVGVEVVVGAVLDLDAEVGQVQAAFLPGEHELLEELEKYVQT